MNVAVRLTANKFELLDWMIKVRANADRVIFFQHDKDEKVSRTHVHGILLGLKVTVQTLKDWLTYDTKWAPTQWNRSNWSFKETYKNKLGDKVPVDEKMITYMAKGSLTPCFDDKVTKGFPDWKAYRDLWIEPTLRQKDLLEFGEDHDSKITQWEMLNQMKARLNVYTRDPTDEEIVQEILNVFYHNHKLVSRYKVRDFFDSIKAERDPRAFVQQIILLCKKT